VTEGVGLAPNLDKSVCLCLSFGLYFEFILQQFGLGASFSYINALLGAFKYHSKREFLGHQKSYIKKKVSAAFCLFITSFILVLKPSLVKTTLRALEILEQG